MGLADWQKLMRSKWGTETQPMVGSLLIIVEIDPLLYRFPTFNQGNGQLLKKVLLKFG